MSATVTEVLGDDSNSSATFSTGSEQPSFIPGHGIPDCSLKGSPNFTEVLQLSKGSSGILLVLLVTIPNAMVIAITSISLISAGRSKPVSIPKFLILLLASTDFTFGLTDTLPQSLRYLTGFCTAGGVPICVTQAFVSNVLLTMSVVLVILMSAERFSALKFPFQHYKICSMANTIKIVIGLIVYSVFLAMFPLIGVNEYEYGPFGCDFQWADTRPLAGSYVYFRAANGLLLMCVIVILNGAVCAEVIKMQAKVSPAGGAQNQTTSNGNHGNEDMSLQQRFMILVIFTSITSVICNTPYTIRLIQFQLQIKDPPLPTFIVKRMFLSNSIVNPLLMLLFYLTTYLGRIRRFLFRHKEQQPSGRDSEKSSA